MKQVLQNLRSGETLVVDCPAPDVGPGHVLTRTRASVISPGTERMLLEFGKASLLEKAHQQPERLRDVLEKVRSEGLWSTTEAVFAKLDQPVALGYCNAGEVIALGRGVTGVAVGDRVVSNAPHAEVCRVPMNLCARIPDPVSDEQAPFAVLGAIALQGIRLAAPTLGETFVVTGLGLLGLLAVQILRSNGCRVIGLDFSSERLELARQFGATAIQADAGEDPVAITAALTAGYGVDGVIVAAATDSSEPISQAARMSRKRGRIVLIGTTGLHLSRSEFYEKEISFQVSCSYGPGRYDPSYEQKGNDYPFGYVRWTEKRNIEAVLTLLSNNSIRVEPLISHRYSIHEGPTAYETLATDRRALGIVLRYPDNPQAVSRTVSLAAGDLGTASAGPLRAAFLGAGNYAARVLVPAFRRAGVALDTIATTSPTVAIAARKYGFTKATTDVDTVMGNPLTNIVVIATRHDSHAELACRALRAGKHVFLEKPFALTRPQIDELIAAWRETRSLPAPPHFVVGFNRRFSPHVVALRSFLSKRSLTKALVYTVNAGAIRGDHWTQDPSTGGGRLIGEACHFIDLCRYLIGSPIRSTNAQRMRIAHSTETFDSAALTLTFEDGSIATIHYLSNGARGFPKERLEIFCGGSTLQLDNFIRTRGFGREAFRPVRTWRPRKGQNEMIAAWTRRISEGGPALIPFDELVEVARAAIECAELVDSRLISHEPKS